MRRYFILVAFTLAFLFCSSSAKAACFVSGSTYTAASSSYSDVHACAALISANGYTLKIPASPASSTWVNSTIILAYTGVVEGLGSTPNTWVHPSTGAQSTVNTSGTSVTWETGSQFVSGCSLISIGSGNTEAIYSVSSFNSATSLTLGSSAGTQAGVPYTCEGSGTNALTIVDDNTNGQPLFYFQPTYLATNNLTTIQDINIDPDTGAAGSSLYDPIWVLGTCTSSGCPHFRGDNIWGGYGSPWSTATYGSNSEAIFLVEMAFGVLDHDTLCTPTTQCTGPTGEELVNVQLGSYRGVGQYGDNSWAQADTYGGADNLYVEDILDNNAGYLPITDSEQDISYGDRGGSRFVLRYSSEYAGSYSGAGEQGPYGMMQNHGTDSGGRPRGTRHMEEYGNTLNCQVTGGPNCYVDGAARSGSALIGNNIVNFTHSDGYGNVWFSMSLLRNVASWGAPFFYGAGQGAFDQNDSGTTTGPSTLTSVGTTTVTDTSQSWTTNQFAPGAKACSVFDETYSQVNNAVLQFFSILSNTATTLTIVGTLPASPAWQVGDTYFIGCSTLYYSGTITSSGSGQTSNVTDNTKTWTTNQFNNGTGEPYSVYDLTQQFYTEIISNNSDSFTTQTGLGNGGNKNPWTGFNLGDSYQILRSTIDIDQPGRGEGNYISGTLPSSLGWVSEVLDPLYRWGDAAFGGNVDNGGLSANTNNRVIAYRDFYDQASGVQTTSSSPFSCNGSTGGTGWGTLANRPSSCSGACTTYTMGCGYFATDANSGVGELYVWESGAWVADYEPYTYPHPDTSGGSPVATPPAPAVSLFATVTELREFHQVSESLFDYADDVRKFRISLESLFAKVN
jgi:hypothetical protein